MASQIFTLNQDGTVKRIYNMDLYARVEVDRERGTVNFYSRPSSGSSSPDASIAGADAEEAARQINLIYQRLIAPLQERQIVYLPQPEMIGLGDVITADAKPTT